MSIPIRAFQMEQSSYTISDDVMVRVYLTRLGRLGLCKSHQVSDY
jgi:hypothetical protein